MDLKGWQNQPFKSSPGPEYSEPKTPTCLHEFNETSPCFLRFLLLFLVFDRKDVFFRSFNLDPRSARINTEAGLYIKSPKLASQVITYMNEGVEPQNSYRLLLDQNGKIYLVTEESTPAPLLFRNATAQ